LPEKADRDKFKALFDIIIRTRDASTFHRLETFFAEKIENTSKQIKAQIEPAKEELRRVILDGGSIPDYIRGLSVVFKAINPQERKANVEVCLESLVSDKFDITQASFTEMPENLRLQYSNEVFELIQNKQQSDNIAQAKSKKTGRKNSTRTGGKGFQK
jgi:hypothetical protein